MGLVRGQVKMSVGLYLPTSRDVGSKFQIEKIIILKLYLSYAN